MISGATMPNITRITEENEHIYQALAQNYEAEFSSLTGKKPNSNGLYEYTKCDSTHEGYLFWNEDIPIGFALVNIGLPLFDIAEFYTIPSERRAGYGKRMAHWIFSKYPGQWQVRQIEGADWAHKFWIRTIDSFSNGNFTDTREHDPEWGIVSIQRFTSQRSIENDN